MSAEERLTPGRTFVLQHLLQHDGALVVESGIIPGVTDAEDAIKFTVGLASCLRLYWVSQEQLEDKQFLVVITELGRSIATAYRLV